MLWHAFCSFDSFFFLELFTLTYFLSYIRCSVDQNRKTELIIFITESTIQRRIQNLVKHLRRSFFTKKKDFRKKLHFRYLTGFWMCLCYRWVRNALDWNSNLDIFWKKGIIHLVRTQHFPKRWHHILADKHIYVRTEMQEMARNVSFSGTFLHVFTFLCTN